MLSIPKINAEKLTIYNCKGNIEIKKVDSRKPKTYEITNYFAVFCVLRKPKSTFRLDIFCKVTFINLFLSEIIFLFYTFLGFHGLIELLFDLVVSHVGRQMYCFNV